MGGTDPTLPEDGKPRRRRWLWRTVAGLVVALIAAVVGLVLAYPAVAAAACPACYGLHKAAPDIYVDGSATPDKSRQMVDMIAAARQRVRDFYGETRSSPRILICLSAGCHRHIGGSEKARPGAMSRSRCPRTAPPS